ncbi:MAG: NADH-quinone oxidoreductase subunit A [Promethearchaeota archaeon]
MIDLQLTHFGIFLVAGLASPIVIKIVQYLLAPNIPRLKAATTTYECGEKPIGDAQVRFNAQFFTFAVVFVLFDILTIFFLLWAYAFQIIKEEYSIQILYSVIFIMAVFASFILIGLFFWMKKGTMKWV